MPARKETYWVGRQEMTEYLLKYKAIVGLIINNI